MSGQSPKHKGEIDPSTGLAAERTLLAWLRTGLAMMGFGFVVARFGLFLSEFAAVQGTPARRGSGLSLWIGALLIAFGVVVNVVAAAQHVRIVKRLTSGEPYRVSPWSLAVAVTLMVAGLGVVMTVFLFMTRS
jgi:putative membrane protein